MHGNKGSFSNFATFLETDFPDSYSLSSEESGHKVINADYGLVLFLFFYSGISIVLLTQIESGEMKKCTVHGF